MAAKRKRAAAPAADKNDKLLIPTERIESKILSLRGRRVMLDSDLAELYGVETKVMNQAVRRNLSRFPDDFAFRITDDEYDILRCHFGTSRSWGGRRYPPYVFTEQGIAMLSSVLNSERAIRVNIAIMRTFVRLRAILATHVDLARRLEALEKSTEDQFKVVFEVLRGLMEEPEPQSTRQIGFDTGPRS